MRSSLGISWAERPSPQTDLPAAALGKSADSPFNYVRTSQTVDASAAQDGLFAKCAYVAIITDYSSYYDSRSY
jgi:hypothetical protein